MRVVKVRASASLARQKVPPDITQETVLALALTFRYTRSSAHSIHIFTSEDFRHYERFCSTSQIRFPPDLKIVPMLLRNSLSRKHFTLAIPHRKYIVMNEDKLGEHQVFSPNNHPMQLELSEQRSTSPFSFTFSTEKYNFLLKKCNFRWGSDLRPDNRESICSTT